MADYNQHHAVKHPNELIREAKQCRTKFICWNDRAIDWITDHVLASRILFNLSFTVPLLVLPMPDWVKLVLAVISSNWIQLWALPALQRSANKSQAHQEAKAEVDHKALTHIAHTTDKIFEILTKGGTLNV